MLFSRGMRDKLSKYVDTESEIIVKMGVDGTATYDFCCFGVDKAGQLSDDRYMIFYNQTASPAREITLVSAGNSAQFHIDLAALPPEIDKLVFTANIDGNGTMGEISKHTLEISQRGSEAVTMELQGTDFKAEKAIISIEIYRKDEWRIAAVASGFNGGLSALLKAFGGTEERDAAAAPQSAGQQQAAPPAPQPASQPAPAAPASEEQLTQRIMGKINLSTDKVNLEKHVVNLSKCVVDLSKKSGVDLGAVRAKVVVVLDYSGSMSKLYSNGTVQRTIDRLVPLGLTFDDNGSIDVYLFQNDYRKTADLTLSNYEDYVKKVIKTSGYTMGGTCYAPVLRKIIEGDHRRTGGLFGRKPAPTAVSDEPTFILFITDGVNSDKSETDKIILKSSSMNVFIQFIGIGKEKFKYLMKLDDMRGRERDNTGFSKMESLDNAPDDELYNNVLGQFSAWLKGLQ